MVYSHQLIITNAYPPKRSRSFIHTILKDFEVRNNRGVRKIGGKIRLFDKGREISFGLKYREYRETEGSRNPYATVTERKNIPAPYLLPCHGELSLGANYYGSEMSTAIRGGERCETSTSLPLKFVEIANRRLRLCNFKQGRRCTMRQAGWSGSNLRLNGGDL